MKRCADELFSTELYFPRQIPLNCFMVYDVMGEAYREYMHIQSTVDKILDGWI